MRQLGLLGMWCLLAAHAAAAETRVALIIGNSDYRSAHLQLTNPVRDATAMQRALRSAGFETILKLNARRLDFYRAVDEFATKIGRDPHAVGLFYFAGHGVQAEGSNYLIPVDAEIESDADLEANAFDVARLLRAMKTAHNEMNIVILDACRDNPLPKTRGVGRGLARMDAPSGTFIAYAAGPGQVADDGGKGSNGVFTAEMINAMAEPNVPLEQMFKKVIAGVRAATRGRQEPWSEASLQGNFYFHTEIATQIAAAGKSGIDPKQVELEFWGSIKSSRDPADYHSYLERYPQGDFAALAANRMRYLRRPVAAEKSQANSRCDSLQERAQLGETLNAEESAYVKAKCP
jgi:Caspase domain